MERRGTRFVMNGGIRMPIGYRFQPTDEELVVYYLKGKASGQPLPASVIPELDVFHTDPWSLPGDLREKSYFFNREHGNGYENSNRRMRVAGFGHWKTIGKDKPILASGSSEVVGVRKTLIFRGKDQSFRNNNIIWFMHKFHLLDSLVNNPLNKMGKIPASENWAVYRVFQRKTKKKKTAAVASLQKVFAVDFTVEDCSGFSPPQPSSPSSSETA